MAFKWPDARVGPTLLHNKVGKRHTQQKNFYAIDAAVMIDSAFSLLFLEKKDVFVTRITTLDWQKQ